MSKTKQYGVPEVLSALETAVARRGERYVYVNEKGDRSYCSYVHFRDEVRERPGCIAGQVYYDLTGKLVPGNLEVGLMDITPSEEWVEDGTFTPDALRVLGAAQDYQDRGTPWGEVLHEARRAAVHLELQNG